MELCEAKPRPLGGLQGLVVSMAESLSPSLTPSPSVCECLSPSLFQNNVSLTIMGLQPSSRLLAHPLSLLSSLSLFISLSVVVLLSLSVQLLSVVGVYYFGEMKEIRTVS